MKEVWSAGCDRLVCHATPADTQSKAADKANRVHQLRPDPAVPPGRGRPMQPVHSLRVKVDKG
eukprot:2059614-Amphidinium_carterae.1